MESARSPHALADPSISPSNAADDGVLRPAEAWALVASQPLAQLSNMALLPVLGAMRADLNLSYSELGVVVSAFGLARLLTDIPAGTLARRWNPRSVLLIGFAVSAVGSALGVLAATAWQVAVVRFLIGVASSTAQAMILAWLVGGAGRSVRGRVMARSEAFFSVAGLLIPALGGVLAGPLGWRVAFVLGAVAAAGGFLAVLVFTRASGAAQSVGLTTRPTTHEGSPLSADDAPSPSGWGALRLGGRVLIAAYIATFVVFFSRNGLLNAVLPVLGSDRFHLSPFEIGILFSTMNAVSIGVVLLGGRIADRLGRVRLLAPGLAVLLVCQLLILTVHDSVTYIVVGLVQAVSYFVNPLPTAVLGDSLPARARPQGIAVYRAVSDLALLCAPAAMGVALQAASFPGAEVASVAVIAVALVAVLALAPTRSRSF